MQFAGLMLCKVNVVDVVEVAEVMRLKWYAVGRDDAM